MNILQLALNCDKEHRDRLHKGKEGPQDPIAVAKSDKSLQHVDIGKISPGL